MYNKEVIIPAFLRQAAKGNVIAIKSIFDRIEGKAKQIFDVDFVTPFVLLPEWHKAKVLAAVLILFGLKLKRISILIQTKILEKKFKGINFK